MFRHNPPQKTKNPVFDDVRDIFRDCKAGQIEERFQDLETRFAFCQKARLRNRWNAYENSPTLFATISLSSKAIQHIVLPC